MKLVNFNVQSFKINHLNHIAGGLDTLDEIRDQLNTTSSAKPYCVANGNT